MPDDLALEITSSYENIRTAAAWLRDAVSGQLLPDRIDDLELAAVEALTNIVRHAYAEVPGQPIGLRLRVAPSHVELFLSDRGRPPPSDLLTREITEDDDPLSELAESGRGVMLIKACVSDVEVSRDAGKTIMRLSIDDRDDRMANS